MTDSGMPVPKHAKDLYPSLYLSGDDIADRSVEAVIVGLRMDELWDDRKKTGVWKLIIKVDRIKKEIVVNKTHKLLFQIAFGDAVQEWKGRTIMVYGEIDKTPHGLKYVVKLRPVKKPVVAIQDDQSQPLAGAKGHVEADSIFEVDAIAKE